jgi:glycosyltransferase involved in cell wall biosynthesis
MLTDAMNFWVIHAQENPAAPRAQQNRREWRSNTLCEHLADRGHHVVRWRSSFSHQAKRQLSDGSVLEPIDNYFHQFIESPDYKRHIGLARIRNHIKLGANFSKVAGQATKQPDLIHVGNVPIALCYAAVRYASSRDIPVVVDVRDLWPDIYVDLLPASLGFMRCPVLRLLHLASFRLNWAFRNATAINGLTQSYLDWGLERASRIQHQSDAVFPMSYPAKDTPPAQGSIAELRQKLGVGEDDVLAVYVGNIGYQSDFDTLIKATEQIAKTQPQFKCVIAGSGPREAELKKMAAQNGNVIFPGWLEGDEIHALLAISTFGLVAYNPVPNYLRNIPNKFSEYLAGGLAIACGLQGEMGQLTAMSGSGFTYSPHGAGALAANICNLIDKPEVLAKMKHAAVQLHKDRFDAAMIYPKMSDHLEVLAHAALKEKGVAA